MSNEIAISNPMQLLQAAVESSADIDKLEKLMCLQERWESNNARKLFFAAMSMFNSECPNIVKRKSAHNSMYAPLGDIHAQIKPALLKCGLSFRFEQEHGNGITVTCIVSHKDGHSEKTTMSAPADTSGSKSPIQAIASSVTYLQRYTLCSALGITTADEDMDGRIDTGALASPEDEEFLLKSLCEIVDGAYKLTPKGNKILRACGVKDLLISNVTERQLIKIKGLLK